MKQGHKQIKKMKSLGVILARGGSRRVPGKNLAKIGRYPMIYFMIKAALASHLNRVIVSTDHPEIAKAAKRYGAEVPFRRPPGISRDVPSEQVTMHAVRWMEEKENFHPDIIVTLQPTTPFCLGTDINQCMTKLVRSGADTVITVAPVQQRPEWMFHLKGDALAPFLPQQIKGYRGVFQTLPKLYAPNGAVYACSYKTIMKDRVLYGKDVRGVVMPLDRSVDVDEPIDLVVANAVYKKLAWQTRFMR